MSRYVSMLSDDTTDTPPPVDPPTPSGSDPNPIPTETLVRYASPTGTGPGTSTATAMSLAAGCAWIDNTAPAGGTLRLLPGTYNASTYWFSNSRNLGVNSAYRVIRSHDPASPASFEISAAGYSAFGFMNGANRILLYDMVADGNCNQTAPPASADGAQYFVQLGQDRAVIPGKDCHHIWIKKCVMHHFYTGGIGSVGADYGHVLPGTVNEMFLVEDCTFYDNCAGAMWGGSAMSMFYPKQGLTDAQVDNMFKVTLDGSQRILGLIFRRNIGYRNFQARADPVNNGNVFTDGNMLTTDMLNGLDYGNPGENDYNRGVLIENNVSFGNGRMYAATYTHPSTGVWVRFNTSVYDGITYRHAYSGVSSAADQWGGFGGWNDVFRIHANLLVYDPNMSHPYGTGVHKISGDGSYPGPQPTPLSSAWNLAKVNASASLGPAFTGATNTVTTDPGLGAPPSYLAVSSGRIPEATVKAWATPSGGSSAVQPSCPYVPSDGVDAFWRPRGAGSVGACLPGGT